MKPHFIGIGAQKTASTWLYIILNQHPQVWMPPAKELHFFDIDGKTSLFQNILFRKKRYQRSLTSIQFAPKKSFTWYLRYVFGKRNIQNYRYLFKPSKGQLSGEITPAYAILSEEKIEEISRHFPHLKIIYTLRNPLWRDWSAFSMFLKRKQLTIDQISEQRVYKVLKKRSKHSKYIESITRWESYFPKDQIFIGFYDEIQQNPKQFLNRLFDFLGVDQFQEIAFNQSLSKKVNRSIHKEVPTNVIQLIAKIEYENIQQVHTYFKNDYTAAWLQEAEEILS